VRSSTAQAGGARYDVGFTRKLKPYFSKIDFDAPDWRKSM
jgi:hypothetical protein